MAHSTAWPSRRDDACSGRGRGVDSEMTLSEAEPSGSVKTLFAAGDRLHGKDPLGGQKLMDGSPFAFSWSNAHEAGHGLR